jgi:acetyltransferase-like isoleucine patch superfamily enzyme
MTYIDPSAVVSEDARLGADVLVWAFTQIRERATIGDRTSIGSHTYVDRSVEIGADCKIQSGALLYEGTTIGDGVFIGPGVVTTNDQHPRAVNADGTKRDGSEWTLTPTTIEDGASLGARSVLVAGVTIGEYAMIAAGAVVTHDVPAFALYAGVPARRIGTVDASGRSLPEGGLEVN